MSTVSLPAEFNDLERHAAWAIPTWSGRSERRLNSSMEDLRAFYDAMLPRFGAIVAHLNRYELEAMPEDAKRLFYMALSVMKVSLAVENFGQQRVPYGFGEERLVVANEKPD